MLEFWVMEEEESREAPPEVTEPEPVLEAAELLPESEVELLVLVLELVLELVNSTVEEVETETVLVELAPVLELVAVVSSAKAGVGAKSKSSERIRGRSID